jgi:hypothetical protein
LEKIQKRENKKQKITKKKIIFDQRNSGETRLTKIKKTEARVKE